MKLSHAFVVTSVLGLPFVAQAETYFGISGHSYSIEETVKINNDVKVNSDHQNKSAGLLVGFKTDYNIALELRGGFGFDPDEYSINYGDVTGSAETSIKNYYGWYGKFSTKLNDIFEPYVILGQTVVNTEAKYGISAKNIGGINIEFENKFTDFSYGLGTNIIIDEQSVVAIEYMQLIDDKNKGFDYKINGASINYIHYF